MSTVFIRNNLNKAKIQNQKCKIIVFGSNTNNIIVCKMQIYCFMLSTTFYSLESFDIIF